MQFLQLSFVLAESVRKVMFVTGSWSRVFLVFLFNRAPSPELAPHPVRDR